MTMHIGIAGPLTGTDVAALLPSSSGRLPRGYDGAPLLHVLIAQLLTRGHRVTAYTLSSDLPLDDDATVVAKGPGFEVHFVPMRPRAWPFNGRRVGRIVDLYGFERRGLQRAMRATSPDVIHAHWTYEFAWATLDSGRPHVITCHDSPLVIARMASGFKRAGYRWLRAAMAWHVLRRAVHVTAVSPYMRSQIAGWCPEQVTVVPNPVDLAAFSRQRVREVGRIRVCMVCNGWDARKNPEPALVAFARMAESSPGAELVVCGHGFGPQEEAERFWQARNLRGSITFLGALRHEAVLDLMCRSDVLLHPSLEESFGVVLAEALAIGLPIVAGRRSGAVPWVVEGVARLVDVTSPSEIAGALLDALASTEADQNRLQQGRDRAFARFAPAVVAEAYEAEYARAAGHPVTADRSMASAEPIRAVSPDRE